MTEMPEIQIPRPVEDPLGRQHRLPDGPAPAGGSLPGEPAVTAMPQQASATPAAAGGATPPAPSPPVPPVPPAPPVPVTAPLSALEKSVLFTNREQSWLAFNGRVLEEAQDPTNPLLERVKFLAIASTNLDEFFEVRVAGVMELVDAGLQGENPDAIKPLEELERIRVAAHAFAAAMHRTWLTQLLPELARAGIEFRPIRQLGQAQQKWIDGYFRKDVYPILTPLAVDPAHPFPVLLNKSLNLAVLLLDPQKARRTLRMAVVQVPRSLPRVLRLPDIDGQRACVFTADVVRENLHELFPGLDVVHACAFRVTRDGNLEVDEMQATDLMTSIEQELVKRRRGEPVRLEIDAGAHPDVVERFTKALNLDPEDVYFCDGPVNLGRILELHQIADQPDLKDPPAPPRRVWSWANADEMFGDLRDGDILLHHPYESFATVEDFIRLAARDPKVLAIKLTIYRAGSKNPLVEALIEAAQQRKQVTAIVELKARFDEEANIQWARRMEQAGVHVVYGIVGLKTHAKCTLVVRREDDGTLRRYCHVGTGNYNPTTARLYTDLGLLSARADLGEEVAETFNMITGYTRVPHMEHLLVAPFTLREKVLQLIRNEIDNKKAGKPAVIRAKLNNLVDGQVILALYEASRAGVPVRLCVRSACCLRPGVPGLSDNITVVSVVDRFLEHSRVYYFENAGVPLVYLSSADWMVRNLDRRVEVAAPILDPELKKRVVDEVLGASLADNVKGRRVLASGHSERIVRADGEAPRRSQQALLEMTMRQPESTPEGGVSEPQKRRKKKKR
ncbi:MAG: polyphosphate kinase 1 [Planctomycetes bacterium]|nr:polyphosphate kinase 1 [Planctomycetota bacterium]